MNYIINDGSKDNSKNIIDKNKKLFNKAVHLTKILAKGKAVIEGIKIAPTIIYYYKMQI